MSNGSGKFKNITLKKIYRCAVITFYPILQSIFTILSSCSMNWNEKLGNQVNQPFSFFVFKERSMQYISVEQPYFCWWFWHLPNICQGLFDLNGIARRADKKFMPILGFAQRATNGKQKNAKGIFKIFGVQWTVFLQEFTWSARKKRTPGIFTPSGVQ